MATDSQYTCIVILGFAHRNSEALSMRLSTGVSEFFRLSSLSTSTWLLVTGGDTESLGVTEGQDLMSRALALGVPASRILVEDQARYTIENALFAYRLLLDRVPAAAASASASASASTTLVVVTNEFHMPRSLLVFQDVAKKLAADDDDSNKSQHPRFTVVPLPAPNGSLALLQSQTGKSLSQWVAQEDKQLNLLRSECGSDFGNVLSQRILAHSDLPVAAKQNNVSALRSFVSRNPSVPVDSQLRRGLSGALHYAALHGSVESLSFLLSSGADPNLRNEHGCTPLHFVGYSPDVSVHSVLRECLSAAGARTDVVGRSALWGGSPKTIDELDVESIPAPLPPPRLRNVGSLLAFGDVLYSTLIDAARVGDAAGVRRWLSLNGGGGGGGSLSSCVVVDGPSGHNGNTALSHAASGGSAECVLLLLEAGADVSLPSPPRANALHYCAFKLHKQCADLLISRGGEQRVRKALGSRGESALWASLGACKPHELARYVAHQASIFGDELEAEHDTGRTHSLTNSPVAKAMDDKLLLHPPALLQQNDNNK